MKKVYPKSKNPIFYSRNVGGKVYKLTITSEGLDISKFPDDLVEDLFQTWGKHLLNEDQHKAVENQAPKVEPVQQEEQPIPEPQPEPVETPQSEVQPEAQPQEQPVEEKKEEPVSEPAPVEEVKEEVKAEEIIPQPEEKKEEPKSEVVKHKGRGNFRRN